MKVLQVNCVYQKGSTGKIVSDIHEELLCAGHEAVVCYGRGQKILAQNVYKVCSEPYSKFNNLLSRFTGLMYGGCFFSTRKLIRIIKKEKPDIVHLHCINGYFVNIYKIINWLKKENISTILTLHAEFMHTANCGHAYDCEKWKTGCGNCSVFRKETRSLFFDTTRLSWKKMKRAFDGFKGLIVTSVSPWLMSRAKESPILQDKRHYVILNGLDTSVFKYPCVQKECENMKRKKKVVFHATPSFDAGQESLKGGRYVIELAQRLPEIQFIVAGHYEKGLAVPENLVLLGSVLDQSKLANYYAQADVTLITSKRETFSMVLAESLCCGTPVVGFKAGAPEQICIDQYCSFSDYGDIDNLEKELKVFLDRQFVRETIAKQASEKYDRKNMLNEYMKIYELAIKEEI